MRQLNKESRWCVKTEEIIANKGQAKSKKQRMIIAKNKRNDNKKKLAIIDQLHVYPTQPIDEHTPLKAYCTSYNS